jgi:hypothetical protein
MVSDLELLQGLESTALSALEYMVKVDAAENKREVTSYVTPVSKGLELLSKEWDPKLAASVRDSLDVVLQQSKNKDYDEPYRSGLATTYEYGSIALDMMQNNQDALIEARGELSDIYNDLSVVQTRSDDSLDLVKDVGHNKFQINARAANSTSEAVKNELQEIEEHNKALNLLRKEDYDKTREGFQVKLNDLSTEYMKDVAEKLGLAQLKEPEDPVEGVADFYLPEGSRLTISSFDDAKKALDKWEAAELVIGQNMLYQDKTKNITLTKDWMLSGTDMETLKGLAIGHALFSDPNTPNKAYEQFAKEQFGGSYSPFVNVGDTDEMSQFSAVLANLQSMKASGKYNPEFKQMQADYINMQKNLQATVDSTSGKTVKDMSSNVAQNVRASQFTLNQAIDIFNATRKGAKHDIKNVPSFAKDETILSTTAQAKAANVELMLDLMRDEARDWFEDTDKEPLLGMLDNAITESERYGIMYQLTNKYLTDPVNGFETRQSEVEDIWNDADRIDLFYSLLKSFGMLSTADPSGIMGTKSDFLNYLGAQNTQADPQPIPATPFIPR